ncbi:hypothetical protein PSP6_690009 [Paraburkholderia tropica]|nr:hypothetical protein PSP6_690009 [Paraburkholderia tropica]
MLRTGLTMCEEKRFVLPVGQQLGQMVSQLVLELGTASLPAKQRLEC